jgi:tight adherence protein B
MSSASSLLGLLGLWALSSAVTAARHRPRRLVQQPRGGGHQSDRRGRRRRLEGGDLAEAVESVAASLRAGRSLADGLGRAAAGAEPGLRTDLLQIAGRMKRGMGASAAVGRWAADGRTPGAVLVAAAVGLSADAGGDLGRALAGVATTLRERRSLDREIRALSAQARASAVVIAVAPLAFAVLAAGADRGTARFLLASPGGWACLAGGTVLDLAGWRWMRRLAGSVR